METTAKYAYTVYKKGSFTRAAKELYISQPSLSAAISRLESELGFRIFDRTTIPCSLTPEGRIYVESLEEIIEIEKNMLKAVKKISDFDHGKIIVGGSSYASYLILSEICGEFYKQYPKINLTLDIGNVGSSRVLMEKLENNEIDILLTYVNSANQYAKYVVEPLLEERLVIAMHKETRGADKIAHLALTREEVLTRNYSPSREIADTSIFSEFEFLEFGQHSDTTERMTKILGAYKPASYKIQNARHGEMHYNLMCAGVGSVLTTTTSIAQKPYDENILFFMPDSEFSYRKIYLVYNHAAKNNQPVKNFVRIAKKIYSYE